MPPRPLTVRQMATRLRLYRLCRLVAEAMAENKSNRRNNPAQVAGFGIMKRDCCGNLTSGGGSTCQATGS